MRLMSQLSIVGLDLQSRHEALTEFASGLATDAAATALDLNLPERAVEFLEQGRGIFWSQSLQLRSPLDDIEKAVPELASKLKKIGSELEYSECPRSNQKRTN